MLGMARMAQRWNGDAFRANRLAPGTHLGGTGDGVIPRIRPAEEWVRDSVKLFRCWRGPRPIPGATLVPRALRPGYSSSSSSPALAARAAATIFSTCKAGT